MSEVQIVPVDERRVVTVLFCDLVGSTGLAGALDAEVLRSVTLQYFAAMRTAIEGHGGTVEKFIGDAVMAVFGLPTVHEDDPRRSMSAALDLMRALAELNVCLARSLDVQLAVRVGINTGEVIATAGSTAGHGLVSGEAVNVAARLEQQAAAGEVLVGAATVRAAGGVAVVEPVGPLHLRGKTAPVAAFRLLGVRADSPENGRRFDLPFVGRAGELAQLDLVLDRVTRLHLGHLLTVFGEPGVGKTRLVRHWLGARVPRPGLGRCRPYGERGTLAPLAEMIGPLADGLRGGPAQSALGVLDTGLLLDGTPNPSMPETVAALSEVLGELAADGAVVLVLDDCHWAQPDLLTLLDGLALPMAYLSVLLVCAARPDLLDRHPDWGRGRLDTTSLSLTGLTEDEARELAGSFAEVGAHGVDASAPVLARAEGNPLFLEQLMMAMADGGPEDSMPPTLQLLLASRIERLAPAQRLTLERAAVVGREFGAIELQTLTLAEHRGPLATADDTSAALHGLTAARLVEPASTRPGPGGRYRFSSGLVHDVAYQAMTKRVRSARHVQCADLLEPTGAAPTVIADHLWRAYRYMTELGQADAESVMLRRRAEEALTAAGRAALARADLGWAAVLMDRALELVDPGTAHHAGVALSLGEVRMARGEIREGTELLRTAFTVAAAIRDDRVAAHAHLGLMSWADTSPDEVATTAQRALPVFRAAGDDLGQARALLRLAQRDQYHGRHRTARTRLTAALSHAVRSQAAPEQALVLGATGVSLWLGPEPAPVAIQRCRDLRSEHGGDRPVVRVTLGCPLAVLLALHDLPGPAREEVAMATRVAQDLGYAESEAFLPLFAAAVELLCGAAEPAERLLRQAIQAGEWLKDGTLVTAGSLDLARLLLDLGRWAEAADLLPASVDGLPPAESAGVGGLLARVEAHRGHREAAVFQARRAVAQATATDSPEVRGLAHLDLARVDALGGRATDVAVAAARAEFARKGHRAGLQAAGRFGAPAVGGTR